MREKKERDRERYGEAGRRGGSGEEKRSREER